MATKADYIVKLLEIDADQAITSLKRVHGQYVQSLEAQQPMIFIHHADLAYVIVLAALWVEDNK